MDQDSYWLALALVPGIGTRTFHRLLEHFGEVHRIFSATSRQLERIPGLRRSAIDAIREFPVEEVAQRERRRLAALGIHCLRFGTAAYPNRLANIVDPPPLLFVRGKLLAADDRAVAVVGSRRASHYGLSVSRKICAELALQGWTVISGMARGVDSAAHRGALEGGGRTVAVLGSGLDRIYPAENRKLAERISSAGAVLSEFPLGTPPEPGNFPVRNRIISGLALGVVVVEATAKSGSLITARMALDQGREVFAVPGAVGSPGVAGPHRLIKEGAKLVEKAEDIIEEILPMLGSAAAAAAPSNVAAGEQRGIELDQREKDVLEALGGEPLHIDHIARQTGLSVSRTAELLLHLEIKGLVQQLPGTMFVKETFML
ncbi:MAG: DNA-protecting protein DprA [Deltaproteobacteria bacterium]|nr:DNA-protecting protein DprA [Deltaproteobacteria bacterium]MBW2071980.1 DNA-protecting protein DprA [Deltaproteobacteria bacterium]